MRATTLLQKILDQKHTTVTGFTLQASGLVIDVAPNHRDRSLDMSQSYIQAMREHAPQAVQIYDRFHVQRLAHDALDQVRREQMRELRGTDQAQAIKHTRWALHKRPWNVSVKDNDKLSRVQQSNQPLYRACLLKEMLARRITCPRTEP